MSDILTKTCRAIVKRGTEPVAPPAEEPVILEPVILEEWTHGGKRPNAGRPSKPKPDGKKSDLRSIRIPDDEWAAIKSAAANGGVSASEFVRTASLMLMTAYPPSDRDA